MNKGPSHAGTFFFLIKDNCPCLVNDKTMGYQTWGKRGREPRYQWCGELVVSTVVLLARLASAGQRRHALDGLLGPDTVMNSLSLLTLCRGRLPWLLCTGWPKSVSLIPVRPKHNSLWTEKCGLSCGPWGLVWETMVYWAHNNSGEKRHLRQSN